MASVYRTSIWITRERAIESRLPHVWVSTSGGDQRRSAAAAWRRCRAIVTIGGHE
jgi:acetyl-CoA carboxylase beta subunit